MPLEKLEAFTSKVQDLSDKPNSTMTAAEVKAQFDAAPDEVRRYLNTLIDDLSSIADGDSGADNLGATAITGLNGETVQAILESLKALDDTNRSYLLSQIQDTVLGQIPDGSIIDGKLSEEPTGIKQRFTTHLADDTSHVKYGADSGTANAKVVTLSPIPMAYVEGMAIAFKNAIQNTGAVTININGLGAKSVLKSNGNALASGNLKANSVYTLRYNGTSFILQGEGGEYGTATASQVLAPNTFGTDAGVIAGAMPNRGTFNLGLGVTVPGGYYSGGTTASGKKWASGTTATYTNGGNYPELDTGALSFNPKTIIITTPPVESWSNNKIRFTFDLNSFVSTKGVNIKGVTEDGLNLAANLNFISNTGKFQAYFSGIGVANMAMTWYAFE